ncbi:MAG: beta-galactosidase [Planctomycetota bacterium]
MTSKKKSALDTFGLQPAGTISPSHSEDIPASRLGIGFECLDRQMFDPERTYDRVGELGVKWARVQTGWARCEQQKGEYDFGWLDDIVDSLLERGVQPWFNL